MREVPDFVWLEEDLYVRADVITPKGARARAAHSGKGGGTLRGHTLSKSTGCAQCARPESCLSASRLLPHPWTAGATVAVGRSKAKAIKENEQPTHGIAYVTLDKA